MDDHHEGEHEDDIVPVGTPGELCVAGYLLQAGCVLLLLYYLFRCIKIPLFAHLKVLARLRANQSSHAPR